MTQSKLLFSNGSISALPTLKSMSKLSANESVFAMLICFVDMSIPDTLHPLSARFLAIKPVPVPKSNTVWFFMPMPKGYSFL